MPVYRQRLGTQVNNAAVKAYGDPIVLGAMMGTIIIVAWSDYKDGDFPPPPKHILAALAVFGILGFVTVSDNRLGKSFAMLILIGVAIKKVPNIVGGKQKPVANQTVPFDESTRTQSTFDFPQANPVGSNRHKIGKKKQPKGKQQK
jgi:hypothetical protein